MLTAQNDKHQRFSNITTSVKQELFEQFSEEEYPVNLLNLKGTNTIVRYQSKQ